VTGSHEQAETGFSRDLSGPNVGRRIVLVGTASTLPGLAPQFVFGTGLAKAVAVVALGHAPDPTRLCGLPTWRSLNELHEQHERDPISMAVVSVPHREGRLRDDVLARLRDLGIIARLVTPLDELLLGDAATPQKQNVNIDPARLIDRTPRSIDRGAVAQVLEGRRVLITGAGGSIGSELCRIAASFNPACIILVERSENALFDIDRTLARRFPNVPRRAVLHDVTDATSTLDHFVALRPHTVFHAAAHKHVPLMEDHPSHAVDNNFFGTKSVVDACLAVGAERFVLISSDKAVHPSSVMGATKRLAEMYVHGLSNQAGESGTGLSMVRFGNVLGSACSVLPIWESQISEGGPVTVTDARMTRYFMTIHEAASLVVQASALSIRKGAPAAVYVLDMGRPVRILDLAHRFIEAHGFRPFTTESVCPTDPRVPNMEIRFTGIRPGEKLHEELAYTAEHLSPTSHPGILSFASPATTAHDVGRLVAELAAVRHCTDKGIVLAAIRRNVPDMKTSSLDTAHTANMSKHQKLRAA